MLTKHLALVGMPGAGKSSTATMLARCFDVPYVDTDDQLADVAGVSPRTFLMNNGEPAFRDLEERVLADALQAERPQVIAVAGGAVLRPANRHALTEKATVCWLQATLDTLVARTQGRRVLAGTRALMVQRLSEREPLYASIADHTVDVGGLSIEQVADHIVEALGGSPHRDRPQR